jgi:serine/threonine protein phosphatase PrpC
MRRTYTVTTSSIQGRREYQQDAVRTAHGTILVVADGVGSIKGSERAANAAADAALEFLVQNPTLVGGSLTAAQAAVRAIGFKGWNAPCTTLVVASYVNRVWRWASIGDSYVLAQRRNGVFERINPCDQDWGGRLTQWVGYPFDSEGHSGEFETDGRVILATDGIEIPGGGYEWLKDLSANFTAETVTSYSYDHGSTDNITVAVAHPVV